MPLSRLSQAPLAPARSRPHAACASILGRPIHVIAETHRHAGHADIVRETIDGSAGFRSTNSNLPGEEADWWRGYRDRLEDTARTVGARAGRD